MNQNKYKSNQWFCNHGRTVVFFNFNISLTGINYDQCPQIRIRFSAKALSIQGTSS